MIMILVVTFKNSCLIHYNKWHYTCVWRRALALKAIQHTFTEQITEQMCLKSGRTHYLNCLRCSGHRGKDAPSSLWHAKVWDHELVEGSNTASRSQDRLWPVL